MKCPNAHLISSEATDIEKAVFELMLAILANMPPSVYLKNIPLNLGTRDGCTASRTLARLSGFAESADHYDRGREIGIAVQYRPSFEDFWQTIHLRIRHKEIVYCQDWAILPGQALTDVDWSKDILDTANTCRVIYTILHDLPKFIEQLAHGIKAHEAQSAAER